MKVDEFYELAEFLYKNPPQGIEEGAYRSAISRYYYFAFLRLRDNIVKHDTRDEIKDLLNSPQAYSAHAALQVYLQELGRISMKDHTLKSTVGVTDIGRVTFTLAQELRNLHNKRKFADYDTKEIDMTELKTHVMESKQLADIIKSKINKTITLLGMVTSLPNAEDIKKKLERKKKK